MRLRNILMLAVVAGLSIGMISCGKSGEEPKPADSTVAPAPAPEPAPAPAMDSAAAPAADSAAKH